MNIPKFKILSIDGGGIRGIIPCQILADLENDLIASNGPQTRLCDYFDLIAGTSTGGIIAIGIALGVRAQVMLDMYLEKGQMIFPKYNQHWISKFLNIIRKKPFYKRNNLKSLLQRVYEDETGIRDVRIGHAKSRLLIPTYSIENREIHVLKTSHMPNLVRDYQLPAVDVALSTAAAPVYFSPYDFQFSYIGKDGTEQMTKLVDGGLVANNPAFMALIEATQGIEVPLSDIGLLSLGTGESKKKCPSTSKEMTPLFWINPLHGPMLYEIMSEAQSAQIHNLLNLYKNGVGGSTVDRFFYVRLQHQFSESETIDLDSTANENANAMVRAAKKIYRKECSMIHEVFTSSRKDEFIPCHKLN